MTKQNKKIGLGLIMAVYLLGIFMGAIDTGIVTPARTVIQNNLMVDEKTGIWMITIYTLAYAASIPIMGKLADKMGRKYIYLTSIFLFGLGSLFCGLSQDFGSFNMLLIARAVQAIGGGGILPVATAEFGTTFPPEKRGMALGLVGGVYGIANIFGASAGSAILDLFGTNNWQFIFYVNLPITMFILIAGLTVLPNTKEKNVKKIDGIGIAVLTVMILCLLYGLKNIDFFDFAATFSSTSVYPFIIIFTALLPLFIIIEKKAQDPVMNLSYFQNASIIITLVLAFVTGVVMMGMIFVPQFSENALKMSSGSGGYFVIILGLFAGIGAPISGRMIDKFGVKIVLGFGFFASIIGSLFLIFVTANTPNLFTVIICLMLIGTGIGFTMGTPLNYMMLDNTKEEESNSALATLSLVRSIGTAIAPAIMIGFIAHAGIAMQANVMELLPQEVSIPPLPYAQELNDQFKKLQTDEETKDDFADLDMPDLTAMRTVEIKMDGESDFEIPDEIMEQMKSSDVTTITANTEVFIQYMFEEMIPEIAAEITSGVDTGIYSINAAIGDLNQSILEMEDAYDGIGQGIQGMTSAVAAQKAALTQLESASAMLEKMTAYNSIADLIPDSVKTAMPQTVLDELATIKTAEDLNLKIDALSETIHALDNKITQAKSGLDVLINEIYAWNEAALAQNDLLSQYEKAAIAIAGAAVSDPALGSLLDLIPDEVKSTLSQPILDALGAMQTVAELNQRITDDRQAIAVLNSQISDALNDQAGIEQGIDAMTAAVSAQNEALVQLQSVAAMMKNMSADGTFTFNSIVDLLPESVKSSLPNSVLAELATVKTAADLDNKIAELKSAIRTLNAKISASENSRSELMAGMDGMEEAMVSMGDTIFKMEALKDALPAAFTTSESMYLTKIEDMQDEIESEFQKTLNLGFKQVYATAAISSFIGLLLLLFYKEKKKTVTEQ